MGQIGGVETPARGVRRHSLTFFPKADTGRLGNLPHGLIDHVEPRVEAGFFAGFAAAAFVLQQLASLAAMPRFERRLHPLEDVQPASRELAGRVGDSLCTVAEWH